MGQIISMQTVLGKIVQLKTRELYKCILTAASWNAPVKITEKAVSELRFWRQNLKSMNAKGQDVSPNLNAQILATQMRVTKVMEGMCLILTQFVTMRP